MVKKTEFTAADLNPESVKKLKSVYKQGYILTSDMASSSGSNLPFCGHAAILHKEKCNDDWEERPEARISISSWNGGVLEWSGKTVGVQEEPLVGLVKVMQISA